jgi:hypothetical protein
VNALSYLLLSEYSNIACVDSDKELVYSSRNAIILSFVCLVCVCVWGGGDNTDKKLREVCCEGWQCWFW